MPTRRPLRYHDCKNCLSSDRCKIRKLSSRKVRGIGERATWTTELFLTAISSEEDVILPEAAMKRREMSGEKSQSQSNETTSARC